MSDYKHIHPDFRYVLGLSDEERLAFLEQPRWIGYPRAQAILDTFAGLMDKPQQPRMPNLLLIGDPNQGKTAFLNRFHDRHGQGYVDKDVEPVKPVILDQAPSSADEKALYVSLLECFHAPYRHSDPKSKLAYQVIHLCRQCRVRLLIIDEFHSLLTGTATKQREVMNAIKFMCNQLCIPVVGAGTRDAVRILHTDPQHASRFEVVNLPSWPAGPDFQKLVDKFERVLPLRSPSGLRQPVLAKRLHAISEGNLGNICRLLTECSREAIRTGTERIDEDIIEAKQWIRPTRGVREIVL